MKKSITYLSALFLICICLGAHAQTQTAVLHNDTIAKSYKLMSVALHQNTNKTIQLINRAGEKTTQDFSNCYMMRTYIQSTQEQQVEVRFSSDGIESYPTRITVPANTRGYQTYGISLIHSNNPQFSIKNIESVEFRVKGIEDAGFVMDELSFVYYTPEPVGPDETVIRKRVQEEDKKGRKKFKERGQEAENNEYNKQKRSLEYR